MPLLDDATQIVLNHAGPFKDEGMSDAARTWCADFIAQAAEGQEASRAEMIERDIEGVANIAKPFFRKLAFVGAFACQLGLKRIRRASRLSDDASFRLEVEDMEGAADIVRRAQPTILCP